MTPLQGSLRLTWLPAVGSSTKGEFAFTLNATDIKTGWNECRAVRNKARAHTLEVMEKTEQGYPFRFE